MFGCQTAFDLLETAEAAAKNHANRGVLRSNSSHSIHFRSTIIMQHVSNSSGLKRKKEGSAKTVPKKRAKGAKVKEAGQ